MAQRPYDCVILLLRKLRASAPLIVDWGRCSRPARHSSPPPFGPARKREPAKSHRNECTRVQRQGQHWKRMPHSSNATDERSGPRCFATTSWSKLIVPNDSPGASEALEKLCRTYWPPLYGYIRRLGHGPEEAEDLTQAFFAKLLQKNFWARADREKGRFRNFLLKALRNFLADERDRARTAKRGGGQSILSLDEHASEERYLEGLSQNVSAEQQFDRQWAATILEQARSKLRQECAASGKLGLYDRVSLIDGQNESAVSHAVIAQELGMTISAIKSAISRLRARYGELVRQEIAKTVSNP